jgi:neurotransmitter:Na+ symporter, NSS family
MQDTNASSWASRSTFFFAMIGATLGLGSIWRTSGIAAEQGGGTFWIVYALTLTLISVPLVLAEAVIGRTHKASVTAAIGDLAERSKASPHWEILGLMCATAALGVGLGLLIISGWVLPYALDLWNGKFAAISLMQVGDYFAAVLNDSEQALFGALAMLGLACGLLAAGVRKGIGAVAWLVVPAVFALAVLSLHHSFLVGDMIAAGDWLFATESSSFSPKSALLAVIQALATLCVGLGIAATLSAYSSDKLPLGRVMIGVGLFDIAFAIAIGVIVYPLILAQDVLPSTGPSLLFVSLPHAFGNSIQGDTMGFLFFAMVLLVLLGTIVGCLQVVIGVVGHRTGWGQGRSAAMVALICAITLVVLSWVKLGDGDSDLWLALALIDRLIVLVLVPIIALGLSILVGWRAHKYGLVRALDRESYTFIRIWIGLLRYVAPVAAVLVLVAGWWVY